MDHLQLYEFLNSSFDDGELQTLCFKLEIDYEGLSGKNKPEKIRELIKYCKRADNTSLLMDAIKVERPSFSHIKDSNQNRKSLGEITSRREASMLIREAVYVTDVHQWPGNKNIISWVLEELARVLEQPILLDTKLAHQLLTDATARAKEADDIAKHTSRQDSLDLFIVVRYVLEPVITNLPSQDTYLAALEHIDPKLIGPLLEREYNRARDDFIAWTCLLFLNDLGERKTLLKLLKHRLLTIPNYYRKAYDATKWLAQEFLRDEFPGWWEREIDGVMRKRRTK